jgi:hypothetical protein
MFCGKNYCSVTVNPDFVFRGHSGFDAYPEADTNLGVSSAIHNPINKTSGARS